MEIISLLIPVALLLVAIIIAAFIWAIRSGQFDDLEGPAYRILMDDEPDGDEVEKAENGDRGRSRDDGVNGRDT